MYGRFARLKFASSPIFLLTVVIPTILSAIYFGLFASPVYISQSKFVVRSPDKPAASGLGVLLKSVGFSNSGEEVYVAQDFIRSRDALRAIDRANGFRKAYTLPQISMFDRFNPFGLTGTFEDLYEYFSKKVEVSYDTSTSITTLTVRAYRPEVAQRFNSALLGLAEGTVNQLNQRGRADLIGYAMRELDVASRQAAAANDALARYRDRAGVVDPEKQATVQLQMISKLQDELIASQTQLAILQRLAPRNPQVEGLNVRINSLQGQIDRELGKVAGGRRSLAAQTAGYQKLLVASQVADKQLAGALSSLEEARNESARKQAYVDRIVSANLPDSPLEPRRLRAILVTMVMGLVAWGVLSMLVAGTLEHKN
jgi:capsular polysaccharide transport system permease protein